MWTKLILVAFLGLSGGAPLTAEPTRSVPKLLYVTQGGDPWHDYAWQAEKFQRTLPQWTAVTITSVGVEDKKAAFSTLKNPDFAAGYDILVYNACFAFSTDYQVISNIQRQARELEIPVILLHCAMHNFRCTSPTLSHVCGLLPAWDKWKRNEKDKLPQWSSFTGMDSVIHEPIAPLVLRKVTEHPITQGLPDQLSLAHDELYIAQAQSADSVSLYDGQSPKEKAQPVVWMRKEGMTEVVGITLGHDQTTWNDPFFWQLLSQSVRYLTTSGAQP